MNIINHWKQQQVILGADGTCAPGSLTTGTPENQNIEKITSINFTRQISLDSSFKLDFEAIQFEVI